MNTEATIDITAKADIDLSDQLTQVLSDMLASGGFWLIVALLSALIVMQGVKAVLKTLISNKHKKKRNWLIFVLSYVVGFQCGLYFLDGPDSHKWAVLIGLINPCIYFVLVQYATVKNRLVLLSLLKMRPIVRKGDKLELDQTTSFMVK